MALKTYVLSLVKVMSQIYNLIVWFFLFFFFNETPLFREVVCGDTVLLSTDLKVSTQHFHCLVLG